MSGNESDFDAYKRYHKTGFQYISKALTLDEAGSPLEEDRTTALQLYKKGIVELGKGVEAVENIPLAWRTTDETRYLKAQEIKDRMLHNLDLAQERVETLSAQLENNLEPAAEKTNKTFLAPTKPRQTPATAGTQRKFNHAAKDAPAAPRRITKVSAVPESRSPRPHSGGRPARRTPAEPSTSRPTVAKSKAAQVPSSSGAPVTPKTQRKNLGALKNVDAAMAQLILDQVIDNSPGIFWDAIAGQESAKQALQETVVWPALRPEIFQGLRAPARGLLLFGPPGNGKTLLAKAVATESKQTFFNISASILTSKWVGEGEKLVRALFACARELQPSIIFIDEVDSILSARKDSEHDAIRRLKTEFLVQFDGVGTSSEDRILVMGATNLPQELDLAALRRFPKRIMIPLPDDEARIAMIRKLLTDHQHSLKEIDFEEVAEMTEGYSGSDLAALARDAALGPIRDVDPTKVPTLKQKEIRPIAKSDFIDSTRRIRPSVPESSLTELKVWARKFGDCS